MWPLHDDLIQSYDLKSIFIYIDKLRASLRENVD